MRINCMILTCLALTVMLVSTACSNREKVEQEAFDMQEVYYVSKKTGLKEGEFRKFTLEGVLVEEAVYSEDALQGKRTIYYENGNPEIIETYRQGTLDGPYQTFYSSGELLSEGDYRDGVMSGIWKKFYINGQVMEEVQFEENRENGPFVEYHENGKLKAEGQYYHGDNEHGLLKLYDENGELFRKMECDSGICRTIWLRPDHQSQDSTNQ